MNLSAKRLFEDLTNNHSKAYVEALTEMIVAEVRGTKLQRASARALFAETMRETIGVAEILGAALVLQRAAGAMGEPSRALFGAAPWERQDLVLFADAPAQTILPRVTFQEALDDFVSRTPTTIRQAAERTAEKIAELYAKGRVVAFVHATDEAVTERAQAYIGEAIRMGMSEGEAGALLSKAPADVREDLQPWAESYARMAFRTNANTAVTAGRFRQIQDPDIAAVIPAMKFSAIGDDDTRPNHFAANGVILKASNPEWERIASPLGYNCRCQVNPVTVGQLIRWGRWKDGDVVESLVPKDAGPDPGFRHGGRPDLLLG